MTITRILVLLCCGLWIATFTPAHGQPHHVLKLATEATVDSPQALQLFALAAQLEGQSEGAVQAKVFPGGRLGAGKQLLSRVQAGEVQVAAISYEALSEVIPALAVISAPHVFRDLQHADRALTKTAETAIEKALAEAELRLLAPGESLFRHWFVAGEAPSNPQSMTKYSVWSRGSATELAEWQVLGISPVVAFIAERDQPRWFRATAAEARLSGRDRLCTQVVRANDVLTGNLVVMSERWFGGLPERLQAALKKMNAETTQQARQSARQLDEALLSRMASRGIAVVEQAPNARRRFLRHGRSVQKAIANQAGIAGATLLKHLRR